MNALMEAMNLIRELGEEIPSHVLDKLKKGSDARHDLTSKLKSKLIPAHIKADSDKRSTETQYKADLEKAAKKTANAAAKKAAAAAAEPEKAPEAPAKTPDVATSDKSSSAYGKKVKIHVGSNLTNKQKLSNASTLHSLHAAAAQHWGNQAYKHKPGSAEYTKAINKQSHSISRMSALRSTIQHLQGN